jgi:copper chaperone NosL
VVSLRVVLAASLTAALGCSSSSSQPAAVRAGDTCAHCRMTVSNVRMAAQIAAPGEDPLFYDDIGCLVRAVAAGKPADHAYVADHRTGDWVSAQTAVYTHVPGLATPMGSHLIAHGNDESRRGDSAAAAGKPMTSDEVFSGAATGDRHGG